MLQQDNAVPTSPGAAAETASIQASHERLGDLAFLAAVLFVQLVLFVFHLNWWQSVLLGAVSFVPVFALNRLGWFKLFGPVLYYDLVRQARRGRLIGLRNVYCIIILGLFVYVIPIQSSIGGLGVDVQAAQGLAQEFFHWFLALQFLAVIVLTPAYVAGSIAEEKDRNTMEFMLATDLLNREIVLSKLASRLATLGLLLATGLPILSILQLVGGIDPNLVLAGFAFTALTMLSEASLCILCSVLCRRPRDAIGLSYVIVVLYYALSGVLSGLPRSPAAVTVVDFLSPGNLLSIFRQVREAAGRGTLASVLPGLVLNATVFHLTLAALCVVLSIALVRRAGLNQKPNHLGKESRLSLFRFRPAVGLLPMLWKEIHRESFHRPAWVTLGGTCVILAAALIPLARIIAEGLETVIVNPWLPGGFWRAIQPSMSSWTRLNTLIFGGFSLLAVGVRAASSIQSEREKETWDCLIITPLECAAILRAKWAGSVLGLRWALVWLLFVWIVGTLSGGLQAGALPFVLLSWLGYAAFVGVLGLWFSATSKSSLQAMLKTIAVSLVVGLMQRLVWYAWYRVVYVPLTGGYRTATLLTEGQWAPFDFGFTSATAGALTGAELELVVVFSVFGLIPWLGLAGGIFSVTNARLKKLTNRTRTYRPQVPMRTRYAAVRSRD